MRPATLSTSAPPKIPAPVRFITHLDLRLGLRLRASTDPLCACVNDLAARAKAGKVQLTWKKTSPAARSDVYRASTSGGPYGLPGNTTSTRSSCPGTTPVLGSTHDYVVRPMAANIEELCQSKQASATATPR